MNPFTALLRLPFLPLRSVIWLAQILQEQAERELHDPANVRRELEELSEARDAGRLSDSDLAEVEAEAVGQLVPEQPPENVTSARPSGKERHQNAAKTSSTRRGAGQRRPGR